MGYELPRFIAEIDEEFQCSICTMVLENPLQTPCDHLFCTECIHEWMLINKTCPVDRKALTNTDLKPISRTLRNLLNKFEISCDFDSKGCKVIVKLELLQDHLSICEYNPDALMVCDKGCNLKLGRREYQENDCLTHLAVNHEKEIIKLIYELSNQKEHYERVVYLQQEEIRKLSDEVHQLRLQQDQSEIEGEENGGFQQQQLTSTSDKLDDANSCTPNNDQVNSKPNEKWKISPPKWHVCMNIKFSLSQPDVLELGYHKLSGGLVQSFYPLEPGNSSFKIQILNRKMIEMGLTIRGHTIHSSSRSFVFYHVMNGQLYIKDKKEWGGPPCAIGDIIELGIKFPSNLVNDENVNIVLYLSINEQVMTEKLIILPNSAIYPTVHICSDGTKVKYLGI